jgi:hypothetical protein
MSAVRCHRGYAILFIAPLIVLSMASVGFGLTLTQASASAGGIVDSHEGNSSTFAAAAASGGEGGRPWEGRTQANASFGAIQLSASAEGNVTAAAAEVNGEFFDTLTISHPSLVGQHGNLFLGMIVAADLSAASYGLSEVGNVRSGVTASVSAGSSLAWISISDFSLRSSDHSGNIVESGLKLPFEIGLTFPFVFGQPVSIGISLFASIEMSPESSGGSGSVSASAYWRGVTEVSGGGHAIRDFQISSSSGTDYSRPIPEPGTFTLLGLALTALMLRGGVRKRRVPDTAALYAETV